MFKTSEECKVADVAEAKTGTSFPGTFCHLKKRDCPSIVGVGARAKRLLGVKNVDGVMPAYVAELLGTSIKFAWLSAVNSHSLSLTSVRGPCCTYIHQLSRLLRVA